MELEWKFTGVGLLIVLVNLHDILNLETFAVLRGDRSLTTIDR